MELEIIEYLFFVYSVNLFQRQKEINPQNIMYDIYSGGYQRQRFEKRS